MTSPTRAGRWTGRRSPSGVAGALFRVPAAGGTPEPVLSELADRHDRHRVGAGRDRTFTPVVARPAAAGRPRPAAGGDRAPGVGAGQAARWRSRAPAGCRRSRRAARPSRCSRARAGPPRWSADSTALVYADGGEVRTLTLATGVTAPALLGVRARRAGGLAAVRPGGDAELRRRSRRRAAAPLAANATTQADQPIDLPAPPCTDPASRPLSLRRHQAAGPRHARRPALHARGGLLGPGHGRLPRQQRRPRLRDLPRDGVRRPAPRRGRRRPGPTTRPPVLVQGAPFLSATATPRLDRKRTTLVKVSCDQDCSLAVRLTAKLRTRKSLTGPQVKRSLVAKQVRDAAAAAAGQAARDAEDRVDHRAACATRRATRAA